MGKQRPTVQIDVPASLLSKTATVEGTVELKQLLSSVFTVFYQSGLFEALTPDLKDTAIQLQHDLNALVDLSFLGQVEGLASRAREARKDQQ